MNERTARLLLCMRSYTIVVRGENRSRNDRAARHLRCLRNSTILARGEERLRNERAARLLRCLRNSIILERAENRLRNERTARPEIRTCHESETTGGRGRLGPRVCGDTARLGKARFGKDQKGGRCQCYGNDPGNCPRKCEHQNAPKMKSLLGCSAQRITVAVLPRDELLPLWFLNSKSARQRKQGDSGAGRVA